MSRAPDGQASIASSAQLGPDISVAPFAVIGDHVRIGAGSSIGAGAVIADRAAIGPGSTIGAGAMVGTGTELGPGCVVEENAVLGKRPRLRAGSRADAEAALEPLLIGAEVTVCCGAVVYAGARIAAGAIIGDQAQVRERAWIGERSVVGRGSAVDFDSRVGDRVLIQTGVYITHAVVVEDDVFIGPGVVTTNDDTMGRHQHGEALRGPTLRRACRIGGAAVLVPGIEIGEEAFVAAGAVVTRDVRPRAVVMGVPARVVRSVPDADLRERWI
jgi:UDP-3-O-[3-hydroxymyristoyl] glucosamine N-acyltransferase